MTERDTESNLTIIVTTLPGFGPNLIPGIGPRILSSFHKSFGRHRMRGARFLMLHHKASKAGSRNALQVMAKAARSRLKSTNLDMMHTTSWRSKQRCMLAANLRTGRLVTCTGSALLLNENVQKGRRGKQLQYYNAILSRTLSTSPNSERPDKHTSTPDSLFPRLYPDTRQGPLAETGENRDSGIPHGKE
jgi:hypothetical protein